MKAVKLLALAALVLTASTSAFAYGGAVAILFNPQTGVWASFHGANDRADAEVGAMNANSALNTDLASLENRTSVIRETWAINGWVALAQGVNANGQKVYATAGAHDSEYDAEQSALNNCAVSASGCSIVRSLASYINSNDVQGVNPNNE